MKNQQMMINALRGSVPQGGGTVAGTQLDMRTPQAPQQQGIDPGMKALMGAIGTKLGEPSVAGAAEMYGPEVAKMGGDVTASPMAAFLGKYF